VDGARHSSDLTPKILERGHSTGAGTRRQTAPSFSSVKRNLSRPTRLGGNQYGGVQLLKNVWVQEAELALTVDSRRHYLDTSTLLIKNQCEVSTVTYFTRVADMMICNQSITDATRHSCFSAENFSNHINYVRR
jgi:hypothetical protein